MRLTARMFLFHKARLSETRPQRTLNAWCTSQDGLVVLYNKHPPEDHHLKQNLSLTAAMSVTRQQRNDSLLSLRDPGRQSSNRLECLRVTE